MKKIIALVLSLICVLSAGGCSSDTANKSSSKNDMVTSNNAVMDQREITEWLIAKLKNEIAFEDNDILTFSNGQLYSIDIKSEETAEMLFQCIERSRRSSASSRCHSAACKQARPALTDMHYKPGPARSCAFRKVLNSSIRSDPRK